MKNILNKYKVAISITLIFAILNLSIGCHYIKVKTYENMSSDLSLEKLKKLQNLNKYFILHTLNNAYHFYLIRIDVDQNVMEIELSPLDNNHQAYHIIKNKNYRYKRKYEKQLLQEVHFYINDKPQVDLNNRTTIKLSSISRLEIIEPNHFRTIASYFFGIVGITAAVFAIILIVILLTKSSCPMVYFEKDGEFHFVGEIYGGAIFKPLQRDDYMYLGEITDSSKYVNIKIKNELKEIQFTDQATIVLCEKRNKLAIDSKGFIYEISNLESPTSAILNEHADQLELLNHADQQFCIFNDTTHEFLNNDLHLTFKNHTDQKNARLILEAKNSWWLDYSFTKFTELFGSYYPQFIHKQRTASRDSLLKWASDNGLPLSVFVKQGNEWKLIEQIPTVGPMALRTLCIPIDLTKHQGENIEIKLSCGFLYWELDAAHMDFTTQGQIEQFILQPEKAITELGIDHTEQLRATDHQYLVQPEPGNDCTIRYQLPSLSKGKIYSVFLHSNGYYEHVRDYTGIPDRELLQSFKEKGKFNQFVYKIYQKIDALNHEKINAFN